MKIFLTGVSCVGKTTIGAKLAALLDCPFFNLDDEIESFFSMPIERLQEKLFYPMIAGRDDGAGLGLSIAQTLVNLHKGLIEFTSRPGHTEFNIFIPICTESNREQL